MYVKSNYYGIEDCVNPKTKLGSVEIVNQLQMLRHHISYYPKLNAKLLKYILIDQLL